MTVLAEPKVCKHCGGERARYQHYCAACSNVQVAHGPCNNRKHARLMEELEEMVA